MSNSWKNYAVLSVLAAAAVGILIWRKKKRNYVKVGRISKLFFFPVKSLKGFEVTAGKCTKLGFEVNGLLDRSFMVVTEDGTLLSQRQAPRMALLKTQIKGNFLLVSGNDVNTLQVEIKPSSSPEDKIIECCVHSDTIKGIDCGDEAASWFQLCLGIPGIRLVRFFPTLPDRKYMKKDPLLKKMRNDHPVGYQDDTALHIISQASLDDLNSKIGEKKITVFNFRPNILADECKPFEEDSWNYIKFNVGAEAMLLKLTTRCLLTTNDPETGILSQKEPLVTLRKYRIPKDPEILRLTGPLPCLGTSCAIIKPGEIRVGDPIFAAIGKTPQMVVK